MKLLLIATTALVCVTSLASAGTLPERQTGSGQRGLDTNGEFLCNYGFKIHVGYGAESGFSSWFWIRAATPIIGKGKSVNEIVVAEGSSAGSSSHGGFEVALYSSHRNKPRKELASATVGPRECGRTDVPISPTALQNGKKYWIVETALLPSSGAGLRSRRVGPKATQFSASNTIVWNYDKSRTHGALSQHSSETCYLKCSYHPGAWKPITGGVPYARVRFDREIVAPGHPVRSDNGADRSPTSPRRLAKRGDREGGIPP